MGRSDMKTVAEANSPLK